LRISPQSEKVEKLSLCKTNIRHTQEGSTAILDDELYRFPAAGENVYRSYDISDDSWCSFVTCPKTMRDLDKWYTVCAYQGCLYVFGGSDVEDLPVQRYDPECDKWKRYCSRTVSGLTRAFCVKDKFWILTMRKSRDCKYSNHKSEMFVHMFDPCRDSLLEMDRPVFVYDYEAAAAFKHKDKIWVNVGFPDNRFIIIHTDRCVDVYQRILVDYPCDLTKPKNFVVSGDYAYFVCSEVEDHPCPRTYEFLLCRFEILYRPCCVLVFDEEYRLPICCDLEYDTIPPYSTVFTAKDQ